MRRIFGRLFGRRYPLVRIHLLAAKAEDLVDRGEPSMEGVLVGRWDGHYVLEHARLLESAERTHALTGRQYIHRDRVFFVQELDRVELGAAAS